MAGGFRLEDFNVKQPAIGKGGFGEVFAADVATKCNLPDRVALKKVKKTVPLVKIKEEIRIMQTVNKHNNIVEFYGHFVEKGENYLIMELCAHGDLRKFIKERGTLSEEGAAGVVKQLICAMRHWHRKGIMHRDLSAGNILIHRLPTGDRDSPIVKVTDFGLARELQNTPAMTIAGTPGYMSNEVFNGGGYNEKTDVFSLGGLLYFMLSGEEPNDKGLKRLHVLSDEAGDLVKKMMAPQERRLDFRQILEHDFMTNSGAGGPVSREISRNSYRNSRSREASHDVQAPIYPRRNISIGRDRSESRGRAEGRVETGTLRRRSIELRSSSQQREPARQGSRADSGFQSAGQRGSDTGERRDQPQQYRPDSVANGFSKANLPWPINTERLRGKRARTELSRTIVDADGSVSYEFVVNGCVANIVRLQHAGGEQLAYFYRPRYSDTRLPLADQPTVEVDQNVRAAPARSLRDLSPHERSLYEKVCYTLFQMGFDVNRVIITGHPLFPWAHSLLMENGDMRVVPRPSPNCHHEKYVRKSAIKNGVREFSYKRLPVEQEGRSAPITDYEIRKNMDTVYEELIQQEHYALKYQEAFPVSFSFRVGRGSAPPQSDVLPRGRAPSVMAASVASAPGRLPQQQLRPPRGPSAPPPARRVDSDVGQVSRNTNPSIASASSDHLTYHPPSDSRRPLRETQSTAAPQTSRKGDFDVKQLGRDKPWFSVCHVPSGRYLRMSTGVKDQAIFKAHQSSPEHRFIFTDHCQVPREAFDLVEKLKNVLSSFR